MADEHRMNPSSQPGMLQWPDTFLPPKKSGLLVSGLLIFCGLVALLAWFDKLMVIKLFFAVLLEIPHPEQVQHPVFTAGTNWDVAGVLMALSSILALGFIHPSIGLAALLFLRPWLDGYTYPTDNFYFLWATTGLTLIWGWNCLRGKAKVYFPLPLLLFSLVLAAILLSAVDTIQVDQTYRHTLIWTGYGLLLFLCIQAAQSQPGRTMLLTALLCSMGIQAVYAVLQYEYLLPFLRQNEATVQQILGLKSLSPELMHRLNVNRAFGNLLFPNALAGYFLLGIPCAVFMLPATWRQLRPAPESNAPLESQVYSDRNWPLAGLSGIVAWLLTGLALFLATGFILTYKSEGGAPALTGIAVKSFGAGLLPGVVLLGCVRRWGLLRCMGWLRALGVTLLTPLLLYAFWLTYSRGAWLALTAALLSSLLYGRRNALVSWWSRRSKTVQLILVLCIGLIGSVLFQPATAADSQAEPEALGAENGAGEGIPVDAEAMLNPASARLRLGYWRVGLRMFLAHPFNGVGLGNFPVAYAGHKTAREGDVREAHNGLLQFAAETGIVGGGLLALFWGSVLLTGLKRLRSTSGILWKKAAAGLLLGLLAWLLHSCVDIHFSHTTLMTTALVVAGLILATDAPAATSPRRGKWLPPAAFMLTAGVVFFASLPPYLHDLALSRIAFINVSNQKNIHQRYEQSRSFLAQLQPPQSNTAPPPHLPLPLLIALFPDHGDLMPLGSLYVPVEGENNRLRKLEAGAVAPPNTFFVVHNRPEMLAAVHRHLQQYLDQFAQATRLFRASPASTAHLFAWYAMLYGQTADQSLKNTYADQMLRWAKRGLEQSPYSGEMHLHYAQALWRKGQHLQGADATNCFNDALRQLKRGCDLNPSAPAWRDQYAAYLEQMGMAYQRARQNDKSRRYLSSAEENREQAKQLRKARQQYGFQ